MANDEEVTYYRVDLSRYLTNGEAEAGGAAGHICKTGFILGSDKLDDWFGPASKLKLGQMKKYPALAWDDPLLNARINPDNSVTLLDTADGN